MPSSVSRVAMALDCHPILLQVAAAASIPSVTFAHLKSSAVALVKAAFQVL